MFAAASAATHRTAIVSALNHLIEISLDAEKGYAVAAADVRDQRMKAQLIELSEERGRFVANLQSAVAAMNAAPENEGSPTGTLHRAWVSVRKAVEGRSDHLVLEECVTAEKAAAAQYEKAAARLQSEGASEQLRVMVDAQRARIEHDTQSLISLLRRSTVPPPA